MDKLIINITVTYFHNIFLALFISMIFPRVQVQSKYMFSFAPSLDYHAQ